MTYSDRRTSITYHRDGSASLRLPARQLDGLISSAIDNEEQARHTFATNRQSITLRDDAERLAIVADCEERAEEYRALRRDLARRAGWETTR